MRVGSVAASWRDGVGDHGFWSQPAVCSWHTTVCRWAGELQTGGVYKVTLGFGLELLDCSGQKVVCRREGAL